MEKSTKEILLLIFSVKVSIFLLIFLAYSLLPFSTKFYFPNFIYPPKASISLATAYKTWDAQHYLFLSEKWYQKNEDSDAFPPLFPFTIFVATLITRSSFISGLLLSNIFSFIAFYLFYVFVKKQYSEKIAYRSLLFLLAFPTAFYFSLIYTESIFLLIVIIFFMYLQQKKLFLAAVAAFFLPMSRLIGIAISIPFLFSYILHYHGHSVYDELSSIGKSLLQKKSLLLFSPFFGLGIVMCMFYITTGSFFTQFSAQQNYISQYSLFSIFNPIFFLRALFAFPLALHGFTNSLLDRLFFVFFIFILFFLYKRVSKILFIYTLCFGILPVLSGSFMSYMRYLVIVFPIFICLAKLSLEEKYRKYTFPFLFFSIFLQTLFIIMHSLNYWVS
ncbi:MAG TPA: hypothetical protein VLB73_04345 [Patescibacteria group bacterium]|nr:hypothetical protein [Patescibacteria group bacterium]